MLLPHVDTGVHTSANSLKHLDRYSKTIYALKWRISRIEPNDI